MAQSRPSNGLEPRLRRLRERAGPELQRLRERAEPIWLQVKERIGPERMALLERIGPKRLALAGGAFLLLALLWLPGGQPNGTDPFEGPSSALDLTLKLVAVLGLVYVSMGALRRYTLGNPSGQPNRMLQVVESTTLGPNRTLYIVRAGDKRLVLGATTNQITTLAELDPEDLPTVAVTAE